MAAAADASRGPAADANGDPVAPPTPAAADDSPIDCGSPTRAIAWWLSQYGHRKRNERHSQPCASVADDDRLILEWQLQRLREGPPRLIRLDVAPRPGVDASEHTHLCAGGHPRHQRKAAIRPRAQVDRMRRECRLRPGHRGQQHCRSDQRAPNRACALQEYPWSPFATRAWQLGNRPPAEPGLSELANGDDRRSVYAAFDGRR